jgi:ariadne-1
MMSDLDISSNCSEISELFDEVDCTDPSDWFLDEEMEDEPMFEILESPDLLQRMQDTVNSVAPQLNISSADALLVLQYFDWKMENLLHDYFDKPDYYLAQAGVIDRSKITSKPGQCLVCLDEKPASEFYALGCNHSYCRDCWKGYLQGIALNEGSGITQTSCISPKCTAKLNERDFEELALPSTLQKYMYFFTEGVLRKGAALCVLPEPLLWECRRVQRCWEAH